MALYSKFMLICLLLHFHPILLLYFQLLLFSLFLCCFQSQFRQIFQFAEIQFDLYNFLRGGHVGRHIDVILLYCSILLKYKIAVQLDSQHSVHLLPNRILHHYQKFIRDIHLQSPYQCIICFLSYPLPNRLLSTSQLSMQLGLLPPHQVRLILLSPYMRRIGQYDPLQLHLVLVDKLRVGLIINKIANQKMMIGILRLAFVHIIRLQRNIQLFIDPDNSITYATDVLAFVSVNIATQKDSTPYSTLLAMQVYPTLLVTAEESMDLFDGLQQFEEWRIGIQLIAEMFQLSPSTHHKQLFAKLLLITVLTQIPQLIFLLPNVCSQCFEMMFLRVVYVIDSIEERGDVVLILDGVFDFMIVIRYTLDQFMVGQLVPQVFGEHIIITITCPSYTIDNDR